MYNNIWSYQLLFPHIQYGQTVPAAPGVGTTYTYTDVGVIPPPDPPDPPEPPEEEMPDVGDVKTSLLTSDHNGWYILNGRAVNTLSGTASANAVSLGYNTNLPNTTTEDYVLGQQTGQTKGTFTGTNFHSMTEANLPNISKTVQVRPEGFPTGKGFLASSVNATGPWLTYNNDNGATHAAGDVVHTQGTTTINFNETGSVISIDKKQRTFNINLFLYLGP